MSFQSVKTRKMRKAKFNLSHEVKLSTNMADLTPVYLQEIVPGDDFSVKSEILMRFAPMVSPIMHRVNVSTDYFFVPNRIVWDGWKDFITGGERGDSTEALPGISTSPERIELFRQGKLPDYMGIPPVTGDTITNALWLNALPFRAYQEIYNEYYRDQNLQDPVEYSHGDSPANEQEITNLLTLRKRAWEKDYFTSALPFAQKGNPVNAPITLDYRQQGILMDSIGDSGDATPDSLSNSSVGLTAQFGGSSVGANIDNIDPDSTGINVEDLRKSVRLQEWLEKNARAGSRYIESILAHFSERVPDYTAQRPIYLGGGKQPVTISEVLQNAATVESGTEVPPSPQGNMAGHGISVGGNNRFKGKFTEHGFVIGIMSVLPRTAYSQGVQAFWGKQDMFQYYWPEFAQLGEQPVINQELYHDYEGADIRKQTFGYQRRYGDYTYQPSRIAGDFRTTLAHWHLGRQFASPPALNEEFIVSNPRTDIFASTEESHKLWVQVYHQVNALRRMPKYNVPTL